MPKKKTTSGPIVTTGEIKNYHKDPEDVSKSTSYPKYKNGSLVQVPITNLVDENGTVNEGKLAEIVISLLGDRAKLAQILQRVKGSAQIVAMLVASIIAFLQLTQGYVDREQSYKLAEFLGNLLVKNATDADFVIQVHQEAPSLINGKNMGVVFSALESFFILAGTTAIAILQGVVKYVLSPKEKEIIKALNTLPGLEQNIYPRYHPGFISPYLTFESQGGTSTANIIAMINEDKDKIQKHISREKSMQIFFPVVMGFLAGILEIIKSAMASATDNNDPRAPHNNGIDYAGVVLAFVALNFTIVMKQIIDNEEIIQGIFEGIAKKLIFEGENKDDVPVNIPPEQGHPKPPEEGQSTLNEEGTNGKEEKEEKETPKSEILKRKNTKKKKNEDSKQSSEPIWTNVPQTWKDQEQQEEAPSVFGHKTAYGAVKGIIKSVINEVNKDEQKSHKTTASNTKQESTTKKTGKK